MHKFSARSKAILNTVHKDMQRLAVRALEISPVDFGVVQGLRTKDEQMRLYGKGRTQLECVRAGVPSSYARPTEAKVTWTLKSNHISGNAIDIAPYVNGKLEWDDNGKLGLWPKLADAFKTASAELGIPVIWGGDWVKTKDRPHFELKR